MYLCNHCCSGIAVSIAYSECVFATLGIQHAKHMAVLSSVRRDINLKLKQIVGYADGAALLARSPKALKGIFNMLQNEATLVGLSINEDKTKYMQIKRTGTKDITHLKIDNFAFENVENFNYLGSILNADNKMNTEIAERIVKGNKAYYANAKLMKSNS